MGLKNKFETAMVNEPPVFEPLKFYCISQTPTLKSPAGVFQAQLRVGQRELPVIISPIDFFSEPYCYPLYNVASPSRLASISC